MKIIRYTEGWKYQLAEDYNIQTGILPRVPGLTGNRWVSIDPDGTLHIREGYAWDGASGPAIDTRNIMRGSLVHDALYQLIRLGTLTAADREKADKLFRDICREDGMSAFRAAYVYAAVRLLGGVATGDPVEVLTAP